MTLRCLGGLEVALIGLDSEVTRMDSWLEEVEAREDAFPESPLVAASGCGFVTKAMAAEKRILATWSLGKPKMPEEMAGMDMLCAPTRSLLAITNE